MCPGQTPDPRISLSFARSCPPKRDGRDNPRRCGGSPGHDESIQTGMRSVPDRFDIVVAGGGHNSLIAAAYLAKAGFRCLVLEGRPVVGGNCVTEELTLPGFQHDSCGTAHVVIQDSPLVRNDELGLADYGVAYLSPEIVVHVPFPDGTYLTQWHDLERTCAEFAKFSKKDAAAYRRLIAEYEAIKPVFDAVSYTPVGWGKPLTSGSWNIPTASAGCAASPCRAGTSSATISRTIIAARSCCGWRSRRWCRPNGRYRAGSLIPSSTAASAGAGACRRAAPGR